MSKDDDDQVLKLVDKEKNKLSSIKQKAEDYKKRSNKLKNFHSKARISIVEIAVLKEALLSSVMLDEQGQVIVDWDEALVESLLEELVDPGPAKKY